MGEDQTDGVEFIFIDVDTQVDFMEPTGSLHVPGAEDIKPLLLRLKVSAMKHGVQIISPVRAHSAEDPSFEDYAPHCVVGSYGQAKIDETTTGLEYTVSDDADADLPDADEPHIVIERQAPDLFDNRHAVAILQRTGKREAVLFGVATEGSVRATALGLRKRGWRVCLVEEGVRPVSKTAGRKALEELVAAGVELMPSAHVLHCLGALGS